MEYSVKLDEGRWGHLALIKDISVVTYFKTYGEAFAFQIALDLLGKSTLCYPEGYVDDEPDYSEYRDYEHGDLTYSGSKMPDCW